MNEQDKPEITEVIMKGDTAALFEAMAKAQLEMGPAVKASANGHFGSKYADISQVLDATLPPLNRNGLCLMQPPGMSDGKFVDTWTIVAHKSGGCIMVKARIPHGRGTGPQAMGSALTYLRRYAAQGICALPAVDDDGNSASVPWQPEPAPKSKPKPKPKPAARGGGFQKGVPQLPPKREARAEPMEKGPKAEGKKDWHPTWPERYEAFMAEASNHVEVPKGSTLMDELKKEAIALGFKKAPAQMEPEQAEEFLTRLTVGPF